MIDADRAQAISLFGEKVSRETWGRLDRLVELVIERQKIMNLVAPSTIPHIWTRHIADSLQLVPMAPPAARKWIDLGAGGGFPGLVIACKLAGERGAEVHLVDSVQKKAAFLRDAITQLSLPAIVHARRIEDLAETAERFDVVTARALAPLDKLIGYAIPLLKRGALGLFPKGQDVEAELTHAAKSWNIEAELVPSKTDPRGRIVVVRRVSKL